MIFFQSAVCGFGGQILAVLSKSRYYDFNVMIRNLDKYKSPMPYYWDNMVSFKSYFISFFKLK